MQKKISRTTLVILILIFVLALVLRSLVFVDFKDNMTLRNDAKNYWLMSHQLVDKGIYGYWYEGNPFGGKAEVSNARVMPGFPVFLAIVYKLIGDRYLQITVVRLLQIIMTSISSLLAFYFVRRTFKKDGVALLTAFFVAVYPTYIFSSMQILTEPLALFTMLLYLCMAVIAFETRKAVHNLLAGITFGLHILVRPTLLPLFVLPFIAAFITGKFEKGTHKDIFTFRSLLRLFLYQLIGFVLIMSPWWIRNMITLGSLIITAGANGNPFLAGTYPYFQEYFKDVNDSIRGNNDKQMDLGVKRLISGLKTDPWLYIKWFLFGKTEYMFQKPYLLNLIANTETIHKVIHFLILIAGVPGMIWHSLKSSCAFWAYLYGLAILALQLLFVPDSRFIYQTIFFVMIGAAYFLVSLIELLTGKTNNRMKVKQ